MINILELPKEKMKKIYDRVVKLKKDNWNNQDIAFHCDINCEHVATILAFAVKNKDITTTQIRRASRKKPIREYPKVTDLSMYNRDTPHTRLFTDPNKIIETKKVTKHFSVAKDFWLFR